MVDGSEAERSLERLMLSDHPALELLNTVSRVDGQLADSMNSDADVTYWLARVGYSLPREVTSFTPSALLGSAQTLRETIRTLLEGRKAEKPVDATVLGSFNSFLQQAQSYGRLTPRKTGELYLVRDWVMNTPERALGPIAVAAAELLASDLSLVKRCESSDCVLWFVDRTKSHHRRWCSASTCGNRHKVAAFRRRQRAG